MFNKLFRKIFPKKREGLLEFIRRNDGVCDKNSKLTQEKFNEFMKDLFYRDIAVRRIHNAVIDCQKHTINTMYGITEKKIRASLRDKNNWHPGEVMRIDKVDFEKGIMTVSRRVREKKEVYCKDYMGISNLRQRSSDGGIERKENGKWVDCGFKRHNGKSNFNNFKL